MKRLVASVAIAVALAALIASGSALAVTAQRVSSSALAAPVAFTVTPNGNRIFYGERFSGRVMRLNPSTGRRSFVFRIPNVAASGEQGLLGLALRPSYPSDTHIWAYVTRTVSGTATNQLLRIRADRSGFAVVRSFPTAEAHNGGRIMFGPDGKLYVVIGENGNPVRAQNLATMAGKMLRLDPDGTVPSDNPRPGSPIIGYGIRNSFGFTFDPQKGHLWETENGPSCNDEINLIARFRLRNYGWGPSQTCGSPPMAPRNTNRDGPNPVLPKRFFATPPALTGAAFCHLCDLSSSGRLFYGDYNTGTIRRARLNSARNDIVSQTRVYDHPSAVLGVETPVNGGPIYFSTSSQIFRLNP
jgi:glucose/arabinose dehydrogenase